VAARHSAGSDASEADLDVLERQIGWQEPLSPDERGDCVHIDTRRDWAAVEERCQSLAAALKTAR
jgi:hypothetical protein